MEEPEAQQLQEFKEGIANGSDTPVQLAEIMFLFFSIETVIHSMLDKTNLPYYRLYPWRILLLAMTV